MKVPDKTWVVCFTVMLLTTTVQAEICSKLTRTACMASTNCKLSRKSEARYVFSKASTNCDSGIAQSSIDFKTKCTARKGCEFKPGNCYCECRNYGSTPVQDGDEAPNCNCYCAGGDPPQCVTKP